MELKELKCKNCGAKIEINEKDTLATCKYCNTSFSINECDNHNSESKKTSISEKQEKQMKTILKFMFFNHEPKIIISYLSSVRKYFFQNELFEIIFQAYLLLPYSS